MLHHPADIQAQQATIRVIDLGDRDPLTTLVALEKELGDQGIQQITVQFPAAIPATYALRLQRLGYQPTPSDSHHFTKRVHYQRAVRFSITEECNYRCFFCHEEGMEMGRARSRVEDQALFRLLDQLAEKGFDDFTFTGGEPLLQPKKIIACLDYMESIHYLPEITFVSNGLGLTDSLLERLQRYPQTVRFNLSLHSLDGATYQQIVSPKRELRNHELARVRGNLGRLQAAGIAVKLNIVLLKGLNSSPAAIQAILDEALHLGITRVKFLELLLTPKLRHLYRYFYRLETLRESLGDKITLLEKSFRRDLYRYQESELILELQHCTCARGCNTCPVNRATNFTAELRFFPCFLHFEKDVDLQQWSLAEAMEQGDREIQQMAQRYGDNSPILIHDHYLTDQEQFYYYQTSREVGEALDLKWRGDRQKHIVRTRDFVEYYFAQQHGDEEDFSQVHKLYVNSYDHYAREIWQSHTLCPQGSGLITTTFFHESGKKIDNYPAYIAELEDQGSKMVLQLHWSITTYHQALDGAEGAAVSIGYNTESDLCFVRSPLPLSAAARNLQPLREPLPRSIHNALVHSTSLQKS